MIIFLKKLNELHSNKSLGKLFHKQMVEGKKEVWYIYI